MLEIINAKNKEQWNKIVKSFDNYDVYFLHEYVQPFSEFEQTEPFLLYFKGKKMQLCYVIEKSDIAKFKPFNNKLEKNKYFDIATPYGYGGPLVKNFDTSEMTLFFEELTNWAKKESIITQFFRLHPLLKNHTYLKDFCELKTFKKTVYLSLENEETIYSNLNMTCRNETKKAIKNGITVAIDNSKEAQEQFKKLYLQTMQRNNADEYYYFNKEFYEELFSDLGKNSNLFNAYYNGKTISSTIIMQCNNCLHYHLSASDKDYMTLSPNKLLIFEIAKWGYQNGYKKLHLGGGNSPEDSLFMFKRSFNKNGLSDYYIGRNIFDIIKYNYLLNLRKEINPDFDTNTQFLIGYRA